MEFKSKGDNQKIESLAKKNTYLFSDVLITPVEWAIEPWNVRTIYLRRRENSFIVKKKI